jgi:histidyl-tRNA synthetase
LFATNAQEQEQLPQVLRCVDKLDKIGSEGVASLMAERGVGEALRGRILELISWGAGEGVFTKLESTSDEARARVIVWRKFLETITALGVRPDQVVFDPTIARGLEYYTSTVFEFTLTGVEGFGSVVGGGRYNSLLATFSDKSLPAVGGSLGIDRLYEYLESIDALPKPRGVEVVVLNMGPATWTESVAVAARLRSEGVSVDVYYDAAKLEKQFKYAETKGAYLAIMIGEEERARGAVKVKNLATREQVEVTEAELIAEVEKARTAI